MRFNKLLDPGTRWRLNDTSGLSCVIGAMGPIPKLLKIMRLSGVFGLGSCDVSAGAFQPPLRLWYDLGLGPRPRATFPRGNGGSVRLKRCCAKIAENIISLYRLIWRSLAHLLLHSYRHPLQRRHRVSTRSL